MSLRTTLFLPLFALAVGCDGGGDDQVELPDSGTLSTVSYADQVFPILEANCKECHQDDTWHPGYLITDATTTLSSLLDDTPDGGSGSYVVPGDSAASIIVDKISNATPSAGGERMPYQRDPLDQADIDLIADWIDEGALDN